MVRTILPRMVRRKAKGRLYYYTEYRVVTPARALDMTLLLEGDDIKHLAGILEDYIENRAEDNENEYVKFARELRSTIDGYWKDFSKLMELRRKKAFSRED